NNLISNINSGSATAYGIYHSYGAIGSAVSKNTVSNLGGLGSVYGILHGNISSNGLNVNNNLIYTISSAGTNAYGIYQSGATNTSTFKNKIYDLLNTNVGGNSVGLYFVSGT